MPAHQNCKPNAPLNYLGAKEWLTRIIHHYIPRHQKYVELFAGSAKVLFAKPVSPIEVINDLDSGLVNFYRVLRDRDKYLELQKLAGATLFSRDERTECTKHWEEYSDEVQRAWAWFVAARQSRLGLVGAEHQSEKIRTAKNVSAWLSAIEYLPEFHERLLRVQVENQDFRKIVPKFDSAQTWFYVDQPNVLSTRGSGKFRHEMSDSDHIDLVGLLLNLRGTCLLSGYPHPLYEPLDVAGWRKDEFEVSCKSGKVIECAGADTRPKRIECLWLNPNLQKALQQEWLNIDEAA